MKESISGINFTQLHTTANTNTPVEHNKKN